MTNEDALKIIERYNYWHGGEDATGNVCIVQSYLYAKEHYQEAKDILENSLKALDIYKELFPFTLTEIQGQKYISIPADDIRRSDILVPINDEKYDILKNSTEV